MMVNSINKNRKNSKQFTPDDVLDIKRVRVPSSKRLQSNILNLTQELPQYTEQKQGADIYDFAGFFNKLGFEKINFLRGFKPYAATFAAGVAVIALSSTLWLPQQTEPLNVAAVEDYSSLTTEQLANEIEWQDLMLLQDELMFAGL